ncbi:MAG: leucine-rich repeat protein, partial [Clostridia bacterium]|nr:leucine-rich repeat protein [Clostridia bacterium]
FSGCDSLTSIVIPDSVTTIGSWAFWDCTSLTNVYYTGTEEQWKAISIGNYNSSLTNATIHYNHVVEE